MSRRRRPFLTSSTLFAAAALAAAVALRSSGAASTVLAWLLGANLVALGFWGWDKWMARRRDAARVPESTLHLMAALGASPASLLGMALFRHKLRDWRFRILHPVILLLQLVLALQLEWSSG